MSRLPEHQRYLALDGLRAVMMLLGVVIHSALCYATWTFGLFSAYHDPENTFLLTGAIFLIHLFRMPAFFVVAGFFGAMLMNRYGLKGMLSNRVKRVLLPMAISWIILFPLTILSAAFTVLGGPEGISTVIEQLRSGAVLKEHNLTFGELLTQLGLIHLWFLYFLMIFYFAAAAIKYSISGNAISVIINFLEKAIRSRIGVIIFALFTFLAMLSMPAANLDTTGFENVNAFLPPFRILSAYFLFFVFGWVLFNRPALMEFIKIRAIWNCAAGLLTASLYAFSILNERFSSNHVLQVSIASLAIWFLVLGIIGAFLRYMQKQNTVLQYLADASYWIYLFHLPFTLLLPGFLIGWAIPGIVKFLVVFLTTMGLSLISYHFIVRRSFLGRALNGPNRAKQNLSLSPQYTADKRKALLSKEPLV